MTAPIPDDQTNPIGRLLALVICDINESDKTPKEHEFPGALPAFVVIRTAEESLAEIADYVESLPPPRPNNGQGGQGGRGGQGGPGERGGRGRRRGRGG